MSSADRAQPADPTSANLSPVSCAFLSLEMPNSRPAHRERAGEATHPNPEPSPHGPRATARGPHRTSRPNTQTPPHPHTTHRTWGGADFRFMLAQLSFLSFARRHRNFRETFAKVPRTDPVAAQKVRYCVRHFGGVFTFCVVLDKNPDF